MADNMKLYEALCTPPNDATKPIDFGKLKGKRDINPQWRYEALTRELGPCGVGWKYTVDNYWTQPVEKTGETMIFVMVTLYIKNGENWSDGIPAYGGDFLIVRDKNGYHGNDEAMKMAITDALGTAAKMLGVAADVYRGFVENGVTDSKYERRDEDAQNAPDWTQNKNTTPNKENTQKAQNEPNDAVKSQAVARLNNLISTKKIKNNVLLAKVNEVTGKKAIKDLTAEEIVKVCEAFESDVSLFPADQYEKHPRPA